MIENIQTVIRSRHSCRTYTREPVRGSDIDRLKEYINGNTVGPMGTGVRLAVTASYESDTAELKELGTYGVIRNPAGFIIGAVRGSETFLEDFGYVMEMAVLRATALGLGTCWLGGTFRKSAFAARMGLNNGETIPAVVSYGYMADRPGLVDSLIRWGAGSGNRKPRQELFFEKDGSPLQAGEGDTWHGLLEMVRLAPSASNRQPWRLVRDGNNLHFFLLRTRGYRERNKRFMGMADLQRVDMGIAMAHFGASAPEAGIKGKFMRVKYPGVAVPEGSEYTASWVG